MLGTKAVRMGNLREGRQCCFMSLCVGHGVGKALKPIVIPISEKCAGKHHLCLFDLVFGWI